jgi:leucyl aminopeptidase
MKKGTNVMVNNRNLSVNSLGNSLFICRTLFSQFFCTRYSILSNNQWGRFMHFLHKNNLLAAAVMGLGVMGLGFAGFELEARTIEFAPANQADAAVVILPIGTLNAPTPAFTRIDKATSGALSRALKASGFEARPGQSMSFYGLGSFARISVIGVGDKVLTRSDYERIGGVAAQILAGEKAAQVQLFAPVAGEGAAQIALGAMLGFYDFDAYRSQKSAAQTQALRLSIVSADAPATQRAWQSWRAVGEGVKFARDMISTPSNIKSPEWFVTQAQQAFANVPNVSIEVLDVPAMEKLGMGLMLGVGQGSVRPPRMLIVRYTGAGTAAPTLLTGKGITFDTGGISLKEPLAMWRMRYDMSGAASAIGTALAQAKRGARVNVVAIAALAENMPDGNAIRPGDVLKAMNGTTVEVLNTDAEGRLVLGDATWYGQTQFNPRAIINMATLTGAARAALGDDYAAAFTNNSALLDTLAKATKAAGEPVWEMPMDETHRADIRSDVADIKNVQEGGFAGASIAARFIYDFVKPEIPWAHFDIAGVAWADSASPTVPKGAVGWGVRGLDAYFRELEATAR